jgi:hypothetical protein
VRQRQEAYRKDPLQAFKDAGYTPQQAAEALKRAGTPEGAMDQLRAELAQERSERQALQQSIEMAKQEAAQRTATQAFVREAADAANYPTLAKQPPAIVLAAARQILAEARDASGQRIGHLYSNKEVLAFLEQTWSAHGKEGAPNGTSKAPTDASPNAQPGGSTPRTLTNGLSSKRYELPPGFDKLDDQEQKRVFASWLETK